MTSPLKPYKHSVSTSSFKIKHIGNSNPSKSNVLHKTVKIIEQTVDDNDKTAA